MQRISSFILLITLLSFASCKGKNKTAKSNSVVQTGSEQIPSDNSTVRLKLTFFSIGQGIDYEIKAKYDTWLKDQQKKVKYDEAYWGREGEVDYCFSLSELNKMEQEKFVSNTKEFLSKSTLVHYEENVVCDKRK